MDDDLKSIELIEFIVTKSNFSPYRFSAEELVKMLNLKSLFQKYGFEFDRFPEVYYDDYDKIQNYRKENFDAKKENEEDERKELDFNNIKIEMLGAYVDINKSQFRKEGAVFLYQDNIEKYASHVSKLTGLTEKECEFTIRLIVLIHELGHWMCHWPKVEGENWEVEYEVDKPKTHESLAQLITYWLINEDKNTLAFFENQLVPKDNENPYALYKKLIAHETQKIANDIIFLRKNYHLDDDFMFEILLNEDDFKTKKRGTITFKKFGL
jgi:hypothetical protein